MGTPADIATPRRLVAIEANLSNADQPHWNYGSGVLIGGQQVLTAAHVVWNACEISVHRIGDATPWSADVRSMLIGNLEDFDMAILDVDAADDFPDLDIAVVNRDVDGDQVISDCWAVGFPRYQQIASADGATRTRESAQVRGTISPLSGLRANVLSLSVDSSPRADDGLEWTGMSGAGVFSGDRLVGVVTEHFADRGTSDITVTPFDQLLDEDGMPTHVSQWRRRLGLSDLAAIPRLPAPRVPVTDPADDGSDHEASTQPPPPVDPLPAIAGGTWVMDIQNMMGTQTVRMALNPTEPNAGTFSVIGVFGMPYNWQAQGTYQVLPGHRIAMQGIQASPMAFPPQQPMQESYTFSSVEQNMLRGTNAMGTQVTWRRE